MGMLIALGIQESVLVERGIHVANRECYLWNTGTVLYMNTAPHFRKQKSMRDAMIDGISRSTNRAVVLLFHLRRFRAIGYIISL